MSLTRLDDPYPPLHVVVPNKGIYYNYGVFTSEGMVTGA